MPTDVPIGTMLPYAGNKIPAGWLACDNAAYPTTTYPQLYAAIGFTYGMDGSNYRVPDTRGVFMRGMDATATRDANRPAGSIQLSGTVPDASSIFTGASASATGGVGYVPAPLAGQQNYVLNGSGKWDGPQYLMVTNPAKQLVSIGTVFKWDPSTNVFAGDAIVLLPNNTQFQLAAGYNFKLTAALNYNTNAQECAYSWHDLTNSKKFTTDVGVGGSVGCVANPQNGTAVAYIATTAKTIVQLVIGYASNTTLNVDGLNPFGNRVSWAAIEVMR